MLLEMYLKNVRSSVPFCVVSLYVEGRASEDKGEANEEGRKENKNENKERSKKYRNRNKETEE